MVEDCAEAGIRRVWMYRAGGDGAVSAKAVEFCKTKGIAVVAGKSPFMFPPRNGFHALHGLIRKLTGNFPKRTDHVKRAAWQSVGMNRDIDCQEDSVVFPQNRCGELHPCGAQNRV